METWVGGGDNICALLELPFCQRRKLMALTDMMTEDANGICLTSAANHTEIGSILVTKTDFPQYPWNSSLGGGQSSRVRSCYYKYGHMKNVNKCTTTMAAC